MQCDIYYILLRPLTIQKHNKYLSIFSSSGSHCMLNTVNRVLSMHCSCRVLYSMYGVCLSLLVYWFTNLRMWIRWTALYQVKVEEINTRF